MGGAVCARERTLSLSCCGARQRLRLSKQARLLPTAATRSPSFFRHWRRSGRSPLCRLLCLLSCRSKKVRPPAGEYTMNAYGEGRVKTLPYSCAAITER